MSFLEHLDELRKRLVEVDALERFMHKAYLGQHQFSIEGLDMTVPMLDALIRLSSAHGWAPADAGGKVVWAHVDGRLPEVVPEESAAPRRCS